jgi:hypothetical protein
VSLRAVIDIRCAGLLRLVALAAGVSVQRPFASVDFGSLNRNRATLSTG